MGEQNDRANRSSKQPATSDPIAWRAYWQTLNQAWRTEPEISLERQEELNQRRKTVPDLKQGIYPFRGMKLDRADVEWLLATHDSGRGPEDWANEQDREHAGLDVRGADLRQADLHYLALTRLRGGLSYDEYKGATVEQRKMAVVLMEESSIFGAQLERAILRGAQLERADLREVNLSEAQLERADLRGAQLKGANLSRAQLEGAGLYKALQLHLFVGSVLSSQLEVRLRS